MTADSADDAKGTKNRRCTAFYVPMKFLFFSCLALIAALAPSSASASEARPNFVIINIDDMGYGDIAPYGSKLNKTPELDRMAAEGRKLTCFYAAPVCSPSRASLMTGCYPKRVLSIPSVLFPASALGLSPKEHTVAELLKAAGYATACIGKWHLGDQPEFLPRRRGFDYYLGLPYSNDMGPGEDGAKSSLGDPLPSKTGPQATPPATVKKLQEVYGGDETGIKGRNQPPLPLMENDHVLLRVKQEEQCGLVKRYTEAAVKFIRENKDKPFFLYLPHNAVHFPYYPGNAFQKRSDNGNYGDWVEEVDWSVGQVLQTLRELHLAQNTLVLFTSDNGATKRGVNLPLRGEKGTTFEGGMREPTIVWWPGKIPAASSTDAVTGMMDVLPTFVKLAGGTVPTDNKIDGRDAWPVMEGKTNAKSPHDVFYYFKGLKLEAVRSGPWKLHLAKKELYNLDMDIGEKDNVAAANAGTVQNLTTIAGLMKDDLGLDGVGPGCRPMGHVDKPQSLIGQDGKVREGFAR